MKVIPILNQFFNEPKLTMTELKALSKEERRELAELAAVELGVEVTD